MKCLKCGKELIRLEPYKNNIHEFWCDDCDIDITVSFNKVKETKTMARTLQEVLDTDLSPDKMEDFTPNELAIFLVDNGIVETTTDVNRIIIEGIQKALKDDDEFPIRYYSKDEEMSEEGRIVENPGEMLTDTLVQQMKGVNG